MATEVVSTIRASGGDYTTLSAWEAGEQRNLVTADEIAVAECYDDWPSGLEDNVVVSGWTVDSTRFPRITVATGHRHTGIPQSGFFIKKSVTSVAAVVQFSQIAHGEWLDLENTAASLTKHGFRSYATASRGSILTNCISKTASASGSGSAFAATTNGGFEARGCLAYNSLFGFYSDTDEVAIAKNCVAAGCTTGFGGVGGIGVATNCVAYGNTTNWAAGWGSGGFGSHNATSSGSDDAPGSDSVFGIDSADFVDAAGNDFHLASGSALIGVGTNLYSDFTTDIDSDTWPSSGAWDIGFDYFVTAGSTYTLSAATYVPGSITASAVTPRVTVTVA